MRPIFQLIGLALLFAAPWVPAQSENTLDPRADKVLRSACQFLAEQPHFMFKGEIWRERIVSSGQKMQFTRLLEMQVKRPDRLHAEVHSTLSQRGFWFDSKTFTVLDRRHNLYGSSAITGKLDDALDTAHDQYGVDLPLMDLAMSDPYASFTAKVQGSRYFGTTPVLGVECHHLAFTQTNIDWQVWIATGPQPFIRKLVITHKLEEGQPQFTALITDWDFVTPIAESDFTFEPPAGASKIEMRNVGTPAQLPQKQQ